MAQVGTLTVDLIAETAAFNANITKAAATLNSQAGQMNKSLASVRDNIAGMRAEAEGAAVGLFIKETAGWVKSNLDLAASIGDVSEQLGVSAGELQKFRFAASQVSVAEEDLDRGLQKLNLSLGNAAVGATSQVTAFSALGVAFRDASGDVKTVGEALPEIADKLALIRDPAQRAAIEVALFGEAGTKLDGILVKGSKGIADYAKRGEELGVVLEDELIRQADIAAREIDNLNKQLSTDVSRVIAQNANAILLLAHALSVATNEAMQFIANYPRLAGALAGAALGSRYGPQGAIIGGGAGFVAGDLAKKAADDANMEIDFRREQLNAARGRQRAFQRRSGTGGSIFSIRRTTEGGSGGTYGNAVQEVARQQALFDRAIKVQSEERSAQSAAAASLPQFKAPAPPKPRKEPKGPKPQVSDFEDQLARLNLDLLNVKRDNLVDLAQAASIDRQMVGLEATRLQASIEADVTAGKYTRAQADQLEQKVWQVAAEKMLTINTEEMQRQADDALRIQSAANDNERDLLDAQGRLAQTAEDRRRLALRLLELDKAEEKARLEAVVASQKATAADKAIASARLGQLNAIYGARADSIRRDTAGPMESYMNDLNLSAGQLKEAMQQIQVDGLKSLNSGLVDAIVNFKSLGDVASNVAKQITSQLLSLAIQKYLIQPLAGLLGVNGAPTGGSGSGGGFISGLISSIGSVFSGGRSGGGPVNAGRAYVVGEGGKPELFVPGVGGSIVPNPRASALFGYRGSPGGGNTYHIQGNLLTPEFWGMIQAGDIAAARAGAAGGAQRVFARQSRRVA